MKKILIKIANICHYEATTPIDKFFYSILILINFIGFYITIPILVFVYWLEIKTPDLIVLSPFIFWFGIYLVIFMCVAIIFFIEEYISWITDKEPKKYKTSLFKLTNDITYNYKDSGSRSDILHIIMTKGFKYSFTFIPKLIIKTFSKN